MRRRAAAASAGGRVASGSLSVREARTTIE
jgi:hypothetical protein